MRPTTVMPVRRERGRRTAVTAALATALAGLMMPLGADPAQALPISTGQLTHTCNASGTTDQWKSNWTFTQPDAIYVNEMVPLSLTGGATFPTEETRWHWWNGRSSAAGSGTLQPVITVAGVPTQFWSAVAPFTTAEGANQASGNKPLESNATVQWATGATPGSFPVQLNGWNFDAKIGNWTRLYTCTGTAKELGPLVVMSKSHLSGSLAEAAAAYRGDTLTNTVDVSVDGGAVAGQVRVSVGTGAEAKVSVRPVSGTTAVVVPVGTDLAPGSYPVTTEFLPTDAVHYVGSSVTSTLEIREPNTTTTGITATGPYYSDTNATLIARVTAPVGNPAGKPTGTVDLKVDGTVVDNVAVTAATGEATFVLPVGQTPGSHTLEAIYKPANAHHFSTSTGTSSMVVNAPAANTTTVVALEAAEIQSSVKPNVTATVSASSGLAKGAVEFRVNGQLVATEPLANGIANVDLPKQSIGTHQITAHYVSNDLLAFKSSTSAPVTLTVVPEAKTTTTTITPERSVSTPSQTTKVTVRTQGGSGTLTGDIVLQAAGQEYTKTIGAGGEAEFILPALPEGEYPMTARYASGNLNWWLNSKAESTLKVALPLATSTALTVNTDRIVAQSALPVDVRVDTASGTPQGVVEISVDGQHDVSSPLPADGLVRTSISGMSPGSHSIVATFVPASTSTHAGSTSSPRSVTVLDQATITLDSPTSVADDARATVSSVVSQISGTPDGDVTFTVSGKAYPGEFAGGRWSAQLDQLAAGSYNVWARYVSSNGAITATAQPVTLVVTPTPGNTTLPGSTAPRGTTTSVGLTSTKIGYGARATAHVKVSPVAAGWVRVNVAGREVSARVTNGSASVVLPVLEVGSRPITAVFVPADAKAFNGSTGRATLTVVKAITKLTVAATSMTSKQLTITTTVKAATAQRYTGKVTLVLKTTNKKAKKKAVRKVVTVSGNGVTPVTVKGLTKGAWTVTAQYSGSAQAGASKAVKKAKVK